MKHFNNIKLLSTFRNLSNALDIISKGIRFFALGLIILQAILIVKETKQTNL